MLHLSFCLELEKRLYGSLSQFYHPPISVLLENAEENVIAKKVGILG